MLFSCFLEGITNKKCKLIDKNLNFVDSSIKNAVLRVKKIRPQNVGRNFIDYGLKDGIIFDLDVVRITVRILTDGCIPTQILD